MDQQVGSRHVPCATSGLFLQAFPQGNTANIWLDIGVGSAGNERVVVQGILMHGEYYRTPSAGAFIPLRLQKGDRLSFRTRRSDTAELFVTIQFLPLMPTLPTGFHSCTTVGLNEANSRGMFVEFGYPGINMTRYEISTGLAHPIRALAMTWTPIDANASGVFRVYAGNSGVERLLMPSVMVYPALGKGGFQYIGPFPVDIPPNTRLAVEPEGSSALYDATVVLHCELDPISWTPDAL